MEWAVRVPPLQLKFLNLFINKMAKREELKINQLVIIIADVCDQKDQANLNGKLGMIYEIDKIEDVAIIKIDRRTPLPFAFDEFKIKL